MSLSLLMLAVLVLVAPDRQRTAGYDPSRDPARDLESVVRLAKQDGKRILLVVGGEWCSWCHILDAYVKGEPEIQAIWSGRFVTLKVNVSPENENRSFLSRYPAISGYPHIFVLEKDGKLLHSQNTAELESGKTYSKDKMKQFLETWKP